MYAAAIDQGAMGGKLLGAGGGGFLLIFAAKENHKTIIGKLKNLLHVPMKFERSGSRVLVYEPHEIARETEST